jgi:hypothetical protein
VSFFNLKGFSRLLDFMKGKKFSDQNRNFSAITVLHGCSFWSKRGGEFCCGN